MRQRFVNDGVALGGRWHEGGDFSRTQSWRGRSRIAAMPYSTWRPITRRLPPRARTHHAVPESVPLGNGVPGEIRGRVSHVPAGSGPNIGSGSGRLTSWSVRSGRVVGAPRSSPGPD